MNTFASLSQLKNTKHWIGISMLISLLIGAFSFGFFVSNIVKERQISKVELENHKCQRVNYVLRDSIKTLKQVTTSNSVKDTIFVTKKVLVKQNNNKEREIVELKNIVDSLSQPKYYSIKLDVRRRYGLNCIDDSPACIASKKHSQLMNDNRSRTLALFNIGVSLTKRLGLEYKYKSFFENFSKDAFSNS